MQSHSRQERGHVEQEGTTAQRGPSSSLTSSLTTTTTTRTTSSSVPDASPSRTTTTTTSACTRRRQRQNSIVRRENPSLVFPQREDAGVVPPYEPHAFQKRTFASDCRHNHWSSGSGGEMGGGRRRHNGGTKVRTCNSDDDDNDNDESTRVTTTCADSDPPVNAGDRNDKTNNDERNRQSQVAFSNLPLWTATTTTVADEGSDENTIQTSRRNPRNVHREEFCHNRVVNDQATDSTDRVPSGYTTRSFTRDDTRRNNNARAPQARLPALTTPQRSTGMQQHERKGPQQQQQQTAGVPSSSLSSAPLVVVDHVDTGTNGDHVNEHVRGSGRVVLASRSPRAQCTQRPMTTTANVNPPSSSPPSFGGTSLPQRQNSNEQVGAIAVRGIGRASSSDSDSSSSDDDHDDESYPNNHGEGDDDDDDDDDDQEPPQAYPIDPSQDEQAITEQVDEIIRRNIIVVPAIAVRPDDAKEETMRRKRRNRLCAGITVGFVASLAILLFLTIRALRDNDNGEDKESNEERLFYILAELSGQDVLADNTTYQYLAFDWLVNVDGYAVVANSTLDQIIVDRYVLALIYMSMGGPTWTNQWNFLSNASVCAWPEQQQSQQTGYEHGVRCNARGFVKQIRLESNNVTGSLPFEISGMAELETISFSRNGVIGTIPTIFNSLTRIRSIDLSHNQLTGSIPTAFNSLNNLESLRLNENNLNGTIPGVTNLRAIQSLLLQRNSLSGSIPDFGFHNALREIRFDENLLVGTVPDSIESLGDLRVVDFSDNLLSGHTPKTQQLGSLREFYLSNNFMNGTLDASLSHLDSVTHIRVDHNQFSGPLSTALRKMRKLERGIFNNNHLTGTLPSTLANLQSLVEIDVSNNDLSGNVPTALAEMTTLRILRLSGNNFSGSMEEPFCQGTSSSIVEMEADCGGPNPQIKCSCCSQCCDSTTRLCVVEDRSAICEAYRDVKESLGTARGTVCECSNNGTSLSCQDHFCQYCDSKGTNCYKDVAVGTIKNANDDVIDVLEVQYTVGRDARVRYLDHGPNGCEVSLNNLECNRCTKVVCSDLFDSVIVNCQNVPGGDTFDGCNATSYDDDGPFGFLAHDDHWRNVCHRSTYKYY